MVVGVRLRSGEAAMKVLVVGAGVIGTVYGAHLAAAGSTVWVLSHGRRTDEVAAGGRRPGWGPDPGGGDGWGARRSPWRPGGAGGGASRRQPRRCAGCQRHV